MLVCVRWCWLFLRRVLALVLAAWLSLSFSLKLKALLLRHDSSCLEGRSLCFTAAPFSKMEMNFIFDFEIDAK
jgi:hypothetical protein